MEESWSIWLLLVHAATACFMTGLIWFVQVVHLAVVWAATMWLSVPRHSQLAAGFDGDAHAALVTTNWVRTIAWTARSVVAIVMAAGHV